MECDPLYKYIEQYSWKGIMLEPQPNAFEKLSRLHQGRPGLKLVNAALSKRKEKSTFYILEGETLPPWAQGMASFDKQNIIKHKSVIPDIENHLKETEIECITFKNLFSQFNVQYVDLLQIDTEGFDAEIIYMFPFEDIKPSIIHFESKHLLKPELEKLLAYLISLDYSVAYDGEEDMLAVHNSEVR
jgi:FkbM family methyltransferase